MTSTSTAPATTASPGRTSGRASGTGPGRTSDAASTSVARALRVAGPLLLVAAALIASVWALAAGGGAAPLDLGDPGPVVRWGLPLVTLVVNLSAALLCGGLATTLFTLRVGEKPFELAVGAASVAAGVFTVASAATGFLTFMITFNPKLSLDDTFGSQLGGWLVGTEAGRTWLITTAAGAVLTLATYAIRGWTSALIVTGIAFAALVPMGTQGHSGELSSHNVAVTSMIMHMMAAALWLGGLLLMVIVRPTLDRTRMADAMSRYSSIALFAFVIVAVSGVTRGLTSLGGLGKLGGIFSGYGMLLTVKVCALIVLGIFGAVYRTKLIATMRHAKTSGRFWTFVTAELAVMGIASGVAVALARTPTPAGAEVPLAQTPAEILTGSPLPPELTMARWFTEWDIDLLWLVACAAGLFFYLAGVWRLHRRGDKWPLLRTTSWVLGILMMFWVTCGPLNAYSDYLFSVHMMGHMLFTMAIPVLLVPGAPITLALRAVKKRHDGTRGVREWILWGVHTPYARVITHPLVAALIFGVSLWVFYFTDFFRWAMYDHLGHEVMIVHFTLSGFLFAETLIGIDPLPKRYPHAMRLLTLLLVMATHAFFGVILMMDSGLMVAEWFGSMGRTWGADPVQDQFVGGGLAWSVGEIPTLVLAVIVTIQWATNASKVSRRADREADRNGDAELAAYNAQLAEIAAKDARIRARSEAAGVR